MKAVLASVLLIAASVSMAAVVVGSPEIPSMDPFCAS